MSVTSVADQHIVAATAATLNFQPTDQDGEPADPGAAVTVTVAGSAGTAIVTDAATGGSTNEVRTVALTAAQTATVDRLTATWTAGSVVIGVTVVDIIGRPLITQADFEAREPKRAGASAAAFKAARREVDDLFRRATSRSFVPRLAVERVWSNGGTSISLEFSDLRSVLWATDVDGTAIVTTSVRPSGAGIATLKSLTWPCGWVDIAYEHGSDRPPDDVVGAAAKTIAARMVDGKSAIPTRATSVAGDLGSTSFVPIAGYGRAVTAIPEVDEVLNAHAWNVPGIA